MIKSVILKCFLQIIWCHGFVEPWRVCMLLILMCIWIWKILNYHNYANIWVARILWSLFNSHQFALWKHLGFRFCIVVKKKKGEVWWVKKEKAIWIWEKECCTTRARQTQPAQPVQTHLNWTEGTCHTFLSKPETLTYLQSLPMTWDIFLLAFQTGLMTKENEVWTLTT